MMHQHYSDLYCPIFTVCPLTFSKRLNICSTICKHTAFNLLCILVAVHRKQFEKPDPLLDTLAVVVGSVFSSLTWLSYHLYIGKEKTRSQLSSQNLLAIQKSKIVLCRYVSRFTEILFSSAQSPI